MFPELIKGNPDNLEGKVTVFSKLRHIEGQEYCPHCPRDGEIFALYAATNPTDFIEKTGALRERVERIDKEMNQRVEELSKKFGDKIMMMPIYAAPIPVASETDLLISQEDVVTVGEYSHPSNCVRALHFGLEFYLLRWEEQIIKKHGMDDPFFHEKDKQGVNNKTYRDVRGKDIRNDLLGFVKPIIDATRYQEQKRVKRLKKEFVDFVAGAPFTTDALSLCKAIEEGGRNPNTPLIEAYVNKIVAIHTEDYITAAKMRDAIRDMSVRK